MPAVTLVNTTAGGGGTTTCAADAQDHTAGNLLCVRCYIGVGASVSTFSDTAGNSYAVKGPALADPTGRWNLWAGYAYDILGDAANVVQANLSTNTGDFQGIAVDQFDLTGAADPFDTEASGSGPGGGAPIVTGVFSTAQADTLVWVGAFARQASAGLIDGNTATLIDDGTPAQGVQGEYLSLSALVIAGVASMGAGSDLNDAAIIALAFAIGGGPPPPSGGQPMMRRWGGTSGAVGGQGIGQSSGGGKMWGRTKSGILVPRRFAA